MSSFVDKLLHFAVGLAVGMAFWQLLENRARAGCRQINPIVYLVMLIWGASGLFFFRKLGIPVLSHSLVYMAIPDWDIPLYQWTHIRLLIHRSWLFHSTLMPTLVLVVCSMSAKGWKPHQWEFKALKVCRDGAVGASVGIAAHLIWDALLSSLRLGFRIHGWSVSSSLVWLLLNLLIGLGIPFLMVKLLGSSAEELLESSLRDQDS